MSAQTHHHAPPPPAPQRTPVRNPFGVVPSPGPSQSRKGTLSNPTPGYQHTCQLDGFDRIADARDALHNYAAALVRLALVPDWGVRIYRHRISKSRVAWFVMLDGPDAAPPAGLTSRRLVYTTTTSAGDQR